MKVRKWEGTKARKRESSKARYLSSFRALKPSCPRAPRVFVKILEDYMKISNCGELKVYQLSFDCAMKIFSYSRNFPREERYSLIDQIVRSSRSVSANIAEAFQARIYEKSFVSKLVIAQCEAAETQTWLDFALECNYIEPKIHKDLFDEFNHIIAMIKNMINNAEKWILPGKG